MKKTLKGKPWPLGSSLTEKGVNFSVAAPFAKRVDILLFESGDSKEASQIIPLDKKNKSGDYWHIEIEGIGLGKHYGYQVYLGKDIGSQNISNNKVLLDPCARGIDGWDTYNRNKARGNYSNIDCCLKSIVTERNEFDFNSHPRPNYSWEETIIYELHIGGFTKSSKPEKKLKINGTFTSFKDKILHLKSLGITTIELLPVFSFDPSDAPNGLNNYWGYSPINWFTPHHEYTSKNDPLRAREEFRKFIAFCHDNGIEVILDVVYNHTSEGDPSGPTISWKGFGESMYYFVNKEGDYEDVSGCGNSIAANKPITRKLIIESMKCWALELGIDGFRFDLGIALSRGDGLKPLDNPPLFEEIEADPALADLKIISEPWDCGGLYKLSDFPAKKISTWNGYFRDDIRKFWKGDKHTVWPLKDRLIGSPDLYKNQSESTKLSINFITSHDGFTLEDLVSFNSKHNLSNGEENRDGDNNNNSFNYGIEGACTNKEIIKIRKRQKRNLISTLLLSSGVPMLLMGDETGRSQGGNNNCWCQNNKISWMNWDQEQIDSNLYDFVKRLILIRRKFPEIFSPKVPHKSSTENNKKDAGNLWIEWHGVKRNKPDWSNWSHTLSYSLKNENNLSIMWLGLNAYTKAMNFELPINSNKWELVIDTNLDCSSQNNMPMELGNINNINLESRSLILLLNNEISQRLR